MPQKERREYPRVKNNNISVKLSGDNFNAITQSLDVSASGIYCKVDRHIPIMTRVEVVLSIPLGSGSGEKDRVMNLEGVVVRQHPVMKDGDVQHYDVAIFFNSLLPKERNFLVEYISGVS